MCCACFMYVLCVSCGCYVIILYCACAWYVIVCYCGVCMFYVYVCMSLLFICVYRCGCNASDGVACSVVQCVMCHVYRALLIYCRLFNCIIVYVTARMLYCLVRAC